MVQPHMPSGLTTQAGPPIVLPSGQVKFTDFGAGLGHFSGGQVAGCGAGLHLQVGQP